MTPAERISASAARPWLPPSALTSGLVERALAQAVDRWSAHWFRKARLRLSGALTPWSGEGRDWQLTGGGLALACPGNAQLGLAGLVLGLKLERSKLNAADLRLADQLAHYCLADLSSRLAELVGLGGAPNTGQGSPEEFGEPWYCSLCGDAGLSIGFAIDSDLMVRLIKDSTPPPQADAPLAPLQSGLDGQVVTVAALVGRCRLSLGELASLELGDVLCLDSGIDQSAALTIDRAVSEVACRFEQDGTSLQLRLIK